VHRGGRGGVRPTLPSKNVPRMFHGNDPAYERSYIRVLEMSAFLSYRPCFAAYMVRRFKWSEYFVVFLSLSNVKEKVYPKVFCLFKNGQKKCPKMKRGEIVWKKQHL